MVTITVLAFSTPALSSTSRSAASPLIKLSPLPATRVGLFSIILYIIPCFSSVSATASPTRPPPRINTEASAPWEISQTVKIFSKESSCSMVPARRSTDVDLMSVCGPGISNFPFSHIPITMAPVFCLMSVSTRTFPPIEVWAVEISAICRLSNFETILTALPRPMVRSPIRFPSIFIY